MRGNMFHLPIKLMRPNAKMPVRKTTGSIGFDLAACLDAAVVVEPGETRMICSGLAIALQPGYAAFIYARSGLGIKQGIIPANCVGVIDSDYRGEIVVGLKNTSNKPFTISDGDRIAQMVICKCELPELLPSENLDETPRGDGGFGSTGKA